MLPATFLCVFSAALLHSNAQWKILGMATDTKRRRVLWNVGLSLALSLLAVCVTIRDSDVRILLIAVAWWRCVVALLTQWPKLITLPEFFVNGGPLGRGLSKVCDIAAGLGLWYLVGLISQKQGSTGRLPPYLLFGPLPQVSRWLVVLLFSLAVNLVLRSWSYLTKSRGSHTGVNDMVKESIGRSLTISEHTGLLGLAAANALCEEVSSRVLWRSAFALTLSPQPSSPFPFGESVAFYSNLGQAAVFGISHYYGIPSGLTGVALTFVYGFFMGWLADIEGGSLWLPLAAHTIADYYIFAILVRQKPRKISWKKNGRSPLYYDFAWASRTFCCVLLPSLCLSARWSRNP